MICLQYDWPPKPRHERRAGQRLPRLETECVQQSMESIASSHILVDSCSATARAAMEHSSYPSRLCILLV